MLRLAVLGMLCVASIALAGEGSFYGRPPGGPPPGRPTEVVIVPEPPPRIANVNLKIGAGDYTGPLGRYTVIGPSYGVAFSMQPLRYLGFEIGYEGARNALDTLRFPSLAPASFWRNGGQALVKLYLPLEEIRPFVGAGFGLSYVSVSGDDGGGRFHGDLVGQLPLTIGIELHSHYFTAGLRATYQVLLDAGFVTESGQAVGGGLLDVQATLGVRF